MRSIALVAAALHMGSDEQLLELERDGRKALSEGRAAAQAVYGQRTYRDRESAKGS